MAMAPPRRPKPARVDPDRGMESAVAGVAVAVVVAAAKELAPKVPVPKGLSPPKVRKVRPASRVAKVRPRAKPMVPMVNPGPRVPQEMRDRGRRAVLARIVPAKARLARVGVSESAMVSALSKGQRALFTLALALGSKPELLVLDDPTLGLDVVARNDFFSDFIGELADRGTTVILTTHDLAGVEGIADRVGILQGSRLALDEDVEQMKIDRGQSLEQIFTELTRGAGGLS